MAVCPASSGGGGGAPTFPSWLSSCVHCAGGECLSDEKSCFVFCDTASFAEKGAWWRAQEGRPPRKSFPSFSSTSSECYRGVVPALKVYGAKLCLLWDIHKHDPHLNAAHANDAADPLSRSLACASSH